MLLTVGRSSNYMNLPLYGLLAGDACARIGASGFDALTGGREGTASQLITLLKRERRRP